MSPLKRPRRRPIALTVVIAVVASMLALGTTMWNASPARAAEPFACVAGEPGLLFQTPTDDLSTLIQEVDLVTGEYETTAEIFPGGPYGNLNAVGYNVHDDFVYGLVRGTGQVVRVGADGEHENLGRPTLPNGNGLPPSQYLIGDVDENGHFWIAHPEDMWYQIDLLPDSPTYMDVLSSGNMQGGGVLNHGGGADWAYVPRGGEYLYRLMSNSDGHQVLFGFSRTTGQHELLAELGDFGVPGSAGAVFADADGYLYASNNQSGRIFRIDVNEGSADLFSDGPASSDNDGARCFESPIYLDFGDAPASYGTTLEDDGPRHNIRGYDESTNTAPLMLGTSIDRETDGIPTENADGDDNDGIADEDGVEGPIVIRSGEASSVTVTVTNDTDDEAKLGGWIDLDGNGAFDPGERVLLTIPAASGTAEYTLDFPATNLGSDTYARFRLFGDVADDVVVPTGPASDGEVEDYLVLVQGTELEVAKTSDADENVRPGDTVTYTVEVTNTGSGDFTEEEPASFTDELAGVLDDATWNDDVSAEFSEGSQSAPPVLAGTELSWTGPLQAAETATFTYSVTLTNAGDGQVLNVACVPEELAGEDENCAATETLLPKLTIDKIADTTELPEDGGTVTYTVSVGNEGPGEATTENPATITDDLSDVLDDGEFIDSSLESSSGEATRTGDELTWSGALAAGDEATITYQVTYDSNAGGSNELVNVACLPAELAQDLNDPCRQVNIPGAALQQWKTSDPPSGISLEAGDEITYTLHFRNTGQTEATVDNSDDLADVLDDADLIDGPTVSDPALDVTRDGDVLNVTGSVPAGEEYTVTYTVLVRPYSDQGDHVLTNALAECDPANQNRCETEHRVPNLDVEKTSDVEDAGTGDTVTYTVTVTNTGAGDYTDTEPATASDDLSDVIDDATFNDDASATAGSVDYVEPTLTWSGPLSAGESVNITYTVTVTNDGNHELVNIACVPAPGEDDNCEIVEIPLPRVSASKTSDPEPGADVTAGDVITYALSWTNDGQAPGVVDATDDLSEVLDDADITSEPVADSDAVTVTRTEDALRVVGPIEPGQTVTVTYEVTVGADGERGDNQLENVLVPDEDCADDCPPPVEHSVDELEYWKSVDPVSGSTVQAGQVLTYTLHFESTGEAPVEVNKEDVLTDLLDDAEVTSQPAATSDGLSVSDIADGRFTVTGTLEPGQYETVTYQVTVRADGERGDDRLGNFLVEPGDEPGDCVPTEGQRPDCTVNHVSDVSVVKSSDPESGTQVDPGEEITYTLTFTNHSANTDADAAEIDYTDHMANVLDDADLTEEASTSHENLTAATEGDTIRVTGSVPSGETYTVTYTVTVKEYSDQGDHELGNVVAITGEEPVCVPDSPLCTDHEVPPPPMGGTSPDLPGTGAPISAVVVLAALLLGAGVLVTARVAPTRSRVAPGTSASMN